MSEPRQLKNWLDSYMEYSSFNDRPTLYKQWLAVGCLAAVVGRKLVFRGPPDWNVFPNLYMFILGPRATFKSSALDDVVRLYNYCYEQDVMAPVTQATDAALTHVLCNTGAHLKTEFQGVRYRYSPVFIHGDEAKETFNQLYDGSNLNSMLTSLYNCGATSGPPWSHKPAINRMTLKHGSTKVYNPCVNLMAASTCEWFANHVVTRSDINGGFASRMIIVTLPGKPHASLNKPPVPATAQLKELDLQLKNDLLHISQLNGVVTYTQGWWDTYNYYKHKHDLWMDENETSDKMLVGVMARKMTHLIKISMLLSVAEDDSLRVEKRHAEQAWIMLTSLEPALPYAFEGLGVEKEVEAQWAIAQWYTQNEIKSFTSKELYKLFGKQYGPKRMGTAIVHLQQMGMIEGHGLWFKVLRDLKPKISLVDQNHEAVSLVR